MASVGPLKLLATSKYMSRLPTFLLAQEPKFYQNLKVIRLTFGLLTKKLPLKAKNGLYWSFETTSSLKILIKFALKFNIRSSVKISTKFNG